MVVEAFQVLGQEAAAEALESFQACLDLYVFELFIYALDYYGKLNGLVKTDGNFVSGSILIYDSLYFRPLTRE
jgi:hypothetical protein